MARRGRPRSPRAASASIINIKMRLYPGEDDDLIGFFACIPHRLRAELVKQGLRSGVAAPSRDSLCEEDELFDVLDSFMH